LLLVHAERRRQHLDDVQADCVVQRRRVVVVVVCSSYDRRTRVVRPAVLQQQTDASTARQPGTLLRALRCLGRLHALTHRSIGANPLVATVSGHPQFLALWEGKGEREGLERGERKGERDGRKGTLPDCTWIDATAQVPHFVL